MIRVSFKKEHTKKQTNQKETKIKWISFILKKKKEKKRIGTHKNKNNLF